MLLEEVLWSGVVPSIEEPLQIRCTPFEWFFGGARIEVFGENAASVKNLVYVELDFNLKKIV